MTETADVLVAPSAVERDVPCYRCGYNVRGLPEGGHCPECAAPVDESTHRHAAQLAARPLPLSEADPRWLRTLAWGCGLVFLGGAGAVAVQVASLAEVQLPPFTRVPMFFTPFLALAAGASMGASREPVHAGRARLWIRLLIRVSAAGWMLVMLGALALSFAGSWGVLLRLLSAADIFAALASWSFFWRLRDVAARFPHRAPRRACTALALLTLAVCLLTFVPGVGEIETEPSSIQMLSAQPIVPHALLVPLLPYSLTQMPRLDPLITAHAVMMLVSLASLIAVAAFHVALRRAAKRSGAVERSE